MTKLELKNWLAKIKEAGIPKYEKLSAEIEEKLLNIENEDDTEYIIEVEKLKHIVQEEKQTIEETIEKLDALNPSSYRSELILKDPMDEIKMYVEKLSSKALNDPIRLAAFMGTKYKLTFEDEVTNMVEGIVGKYYKYNTELVNNKLKYFPNVPKLEENPKIIVQSAIAYFDTKQAYTDNSNLLKTILTAIRESIYPLLSFSFILMFLGMGTIFSVFKDFFAAHLTYKWLFVLAVIVSVILAVVQYFKKPKLPAHLVDAALSTLKNDLINNNIGLSTKYSDAVNTHFKMVTDLYKAQKNKLDELIF